MHVMSFAHPKCRQPPTEGKGKQHDVQKIDFKSNFHMHVIGKKYIVVLRQFKTVQDSLRQFEAFQRQFKDSSKTVQRQFKDRLKTVHRHFKNSQR